MLAGASQTAGAIRLYETNLVVARLGNGTQLLSSTGNSVFLDQFTTAGAYLNSTAIPDTGASAAVLAGGTYVEGYLTRSADGRLLCLAMYRTNVGSTVVLGGASSVSVPRIIATIDGLGNFSQAVVDTNDFSGVAWRCAATDGTNSFWGVGAGGGLLYLGYGPRAAVETSKSNCRVVQVFNGNLYMSSASSNADGYTGIYMFSGLPKTGVGLPAPIIYTNTFVSLNGITDFAVNPPRTVIYFADDRIPSGVVGGIQRWDSNTVKGIWVNTYNLTNGLPAGVGASHLNVDWSGPAPILYATTSLTSQNHLVKVIDTGANSSFITLATAGTNQLFRGVKFGLSDPALAATNPVAMRQSLPASLYAGGVPSQSSVWVDFPGATNIDMTLAPGMARYSSDPSIVSVTQDGWLTPHRLGTVTLTASYGGLTNQAQLTTTLPVGYKTGALVHRYSFSEAPGSANVTDSAGGAHGVVVNLKPGSTNDNFTGAGRLFLAGGVNSTDDPFAGYVNLPDGLVSGLTSVTIEGWVTWNGLATDMWPRVFDFGRNNALNSQGGFQSGAFGTTGIDYMYLTSRSGDASVSYHARFGASFQGVEDPMLNAPAQFALGAETHFAVVYDPPSGAARLFINGQLAAIGAASDLLSGIEDFNVWLGRSQWSGDPFFCGWYNEFRIYDGALLDDAIAASYASGPDIFAGPTEAPANDNFTNATLLSGGSVSVCGSTVGATKEAGEPSHAGSSGGRSAWWCWKPVTYGPVTVDTIGSTFDTLLAVYTGSSVSNLTPAASDDDSGGNLNSKLTFIGVPGTLYYIAVDGAKAACGGVVLHLEQPVPVAPVFATQPVSCAVAIGYGVTFNGTATGLPVLGYQWFKNSAAIPGATNASFSLSAVQAGDAGSYSVTASNVLGLSSSSNALLSVIQPYFFTNLAGLSGAAGAVDDVGSAARFRNPHGLCLDGAGNIYVAESGNHLIRKITPAGVVTTLAGLAQTAGTNDGGGGSARFRAPWGIVAANPTSLYVADSGNHAIRKLTFTGSNWMASTLAGYGGVSGNANGTGSAARFNAPRDLAIDGSGNLYVADYGNQMIRKVTSSGVVTTIAGAGGSIGALNGAGSSARFNSPAGIEIDSAGNLYVCDMYNRTIRKLTLSGSAWSVGTMAGVAPLNGANDGPAAAARFAGPSGIAIDANGYLYVVDFLASTIRRVAPDGGACTLAGLPGFSGARNDVGIFARLGHPRAIAVDAAGDIYLSDFDNHVIRVGYPSSGPVPPTIASQPRNQSVAVGSNAAFSVVASGTPPMNPRWLFSTTNLPGANDFALGLTNVVTGQAGYYQVIVTNSIGSVTSSPVTLSLIGVPVRFQTSASRLFSDGFHLELSGFTGQGTLVVQTSTNLKNWTPFFTNPPSFAPLDLVDPLATNSPQRFYRAVFP